MSNKAITWAYKQRTLGTEPMKVGAKAVLVALADFADHEHSCFPTVTALAEMTSMSATAVKTNLALLLAAGLVTREERRRADGSRTSNRYYLDVDGVLTESQQGTDSGPSQGTDSDPLKGRIPTHPQADSGPPKKNPQENPHLNPHSLRADDPATLLEVTNDAEPTLDELFDRFWQVWPRREAKKAAQKAFEKAVPVAVRMLRAGGVPLTRPATPADAAAAITTSAEWWARWWADTEHRPLDKIPHPATWLNGERWADTRPDPALALQGRRPTRTEENLAVVARYAAAEAAAPREIEL